MNLYRHSGKIPPLGIPLTILFGTATAAVLGFIYSYIVVYDPIIYINMLCTLGYGFAIGVAVAKGVRLGKIRNPILAGAYGLLFGVAGLYFAWVADIWARQKCPFELLAFQPRILIAYISIFYEKGQWTISHHGGPGHTVKGLELGAIWIVEACVIIGFATYKAYKSVADFPFCEACDTWTKTNDGASLLTYNPELQQRVATGDLIALDEAMRASGNENIYTQLDLHCCEKCDDSIFLTVNAVNVTIDRRGNRKPKKKVLLKHLIIGPEDVARVLAAGKRTALPEPPPHSPSRTSYNKGV